VLREAVGGQLLGTLAPRNLCYFSHVRQKKTGDSLQKDHPKKMKWSRKPSWCKGYARQCRHSKMAVSRHLGCYRTGNSAIRSADPEYPCVEPNMEWIGCTVFGIFAFKLYCDLESGVQGHSRSSKVAPLDRLTRKPDPRSKHHVDQQNGCEVVAIFVYPRWPSAAILDFIELQIAPFDPPTLKTLA